MISVVEARQKILKPLLPTGVETVGLAGALGRVLAEEVRARVTQPPVAVSAMDGYAVRAADVAQTPATLRQIGEAPAGGAYDGVVGPGETVRIFTGGPVPCGADAIVIQEDAVANGEKIIVKEGTPKGKYIRPAGLDFSEGEVGLRSGQVLDARDVALAASMNCPWLRVHRKPRIAVLATGDELVMPGRTSGTQSDREFQQRRPLRLRRGVRRRSGRPRHCSRHRGLAQDSRCRGEGRGYARHHRRRIRRRS